jgi:hypothetical protein
MPGVIWAGAVNLSFRKVGSPFPVLQVKRCAGRDRNGGSVFLQTDPIPGGSANNYDYVNQNPASNTDLAGTQGGGRDTVNRC